MIVRGGMDFWRLLRLLGPILAGLLAYDVALTLLYVAFGWTWLGIPALPLPLLGSAIALVVTLRNNTAYARWWEARALWGAVVNNSRNFMRGLLAAVDDPALQATLARHQIAYVRALRCHLLRLDPWTEIAPYLPPTTAEQLRTTANVPAGIQMAMAALMAKARTTNTLNPIGAAALEASLSALMDAQGGMERIKNTPMPAQFNQIPALFTAIYCIVLPMGLLADLGYLTPAGSTLIGFMFLALDRIGRDLENPFEGSVYDIPMLALSRTVEIDLTQAAALGEAPKPVAAVNGVLW